MARHTTGRSLAFQGTPHSPRVRRATVGCAYAASQILITLLLPRAAKGTARCTDAVHNALSNLTATGLSWMCCAAAGFCIPFSATDSCGGLNATYAQCISVGGVSACGLNRSYGMSAEVGAPCGAYVGRAAGAPVELLAGSAYYPLPITMLAPHVLENWPALGYESDLALCCSPRGCSVTSVRRILADECAAGQLMVKCAGDATRGVCATHLASGDTGQYFLVNAAASGAPTAASAVPSSGQTLETHAGALGAPPTALPAKDPDDKHPGLPPWAAGLIAVLGAGLACTLGLLFLYQRRRITAHSRSSNIPSAYPLAGQVAHITMPPDVPPAYATASGGRPKVLPW